MQPRYINGIAVSRDRRCRRLPFLEICRERLDPDDLSFHDVLPGEPEGGVACSVHSFTPCAAGNYPCSVRSGSKCRRRDGGRPVGFAVRIGRGGFRGNPQKAHPPPRLHDFVKSPLPFSEGCSHICRKPAAMPATRPLGWLINVNRAARNPMKMPRRCLRGRAAG